jgi:hypothetical protein
LSDSGALDVRAGGGAAARDAVWIGRDAGSGAAARCCGLAGANGGAAALIGCGSGMAIGEGCCDIEAAGAASATIGWSGRMVMVWTFFGSPPITPLPACAV